jgi:hypothetical protein
MSCPDAFDACDAKDKEPITVFFSQLHMHKTGVKMTSQACAADRPRCPGAGYGCLPERVRCHRHKLTWGTRLQRRRPDGKLETAVKGEFFNFGFQDSNLYARPMGHRTHAEPNTGCIRSKRWLIRNSLKRA